MTAAPPDVHVTEPARASFPRCPICGSWDVQRHAENFRVWFTCRRCGREFTRGS
ncbi:MAG: hypothetical protein ACO35E_06395 [Ilumatobacteraceae bacterium]|jgi:ribosomal protein L37AE/L43A